MTAAQVAAVSLTAPGAGNDCDKLSASYDSATNQLTVNFDTTGSVNGTVDFINNSKSCSLTFSVTIGYDGPTGSTSNPSQVWTVGYGTPTNIQSKTVTNQAAVTVSSCDDTYEAMADDTNATGNSLVFGSTNNQLHTLDSPSDVDWTTISLVAGHTYTFSVSAVGSEVNPLLRLYSTDGATLLSSANSNGLGGSETITYTPTTSGTYYIRVSDAGTGGTGACANRNYTLGVTGSLTTTTTPASAQDNTIWQGQPTSAWGTQPFLAVANQNPANNAPAKSLIKFDLSTIPSTATVASTSMTLHVCTTVNVPGFGNIPCSQGSAAIATALYPLLVSWSETTSTWNQRSTGINWNTAGASGAGTDYTNSAMATANVATATNANVTWTFASLTAVQGWVASAASNFGLLLTYTGAQVNQTSYRLFQSGEAGTNVPSMTVTYR